MHYFMLCKPTRILRFPKKENRKIGTLVKISNFYKSPHKIFNYDLEVYLTLLLLTLRC